MKLWLFYLHSLSADYGVDVDDLLVLLALLYLDVLDLLLYDDFADAQFESLDALDELADVVGLDVDCQCQSLWSRCPILLRTILDALFPRC